jgi:hypothetical protein
MDEGGLIGRLSFLGRGTPPGFVVRLITLPPGRQRSYVEGEWTDALVVVERGAVELETRGGACGLFFCGDVLSLDGLQLRALRNAGRAPVLLTAISRSGSSRLDSCADPEPPIPLPGAGV